MRSSEALNPPADLFDPELVPVDYDDEAMAEAYQEMLRANPDLDEEYDRWGYE
jgi:hypothetical protein